MTEEEIATRKAKMNGMNRIKRLANHNPLSQMDSRLDDISDIVSSLKGMGKREEKREGRNRKQRDDEHNRAG